MATYKYRRTHVVAGREGSNVTVQSMIRHRTKNIAGRYRMFGDLPYVDAIGANGTNEFRYFID